MIKNETTWKGMRWQENHYLTKMTVILREMSRKDGKVRLSNLEIVNNYHVFIFQGITSLLANGVYSAAYPLHDVSDLGIYFTCLLSDSKKSLMCYILMASSQTDPGFLLACVTTAVTSASCFHHSARF